jgi:hypothetical protein
MLSELTSVGPGALTIYRNVPGRFTKFGESKFGLLPKVLKDATVQIGR